MKFQNCLFSILLLFCFGFTAEAQQKNEVRPYTIATTYEKLKKDYPFISPIKPLESERVVNRENMVYRKTTADWTAAVIGQSL